MEQLVFEIPASDVVLKEKLLVVKQAAWKKIVLAIPALIGLLLNAPFYLPIKHFTKTRTFSTDHYDSVLLALLVFFYPAYLLLLTLICFFLACSWMSLLVIPGLLFTAWAYVQLKKQLD